MSASINSEIPVLSRRRSKLLVPEIYVQESDTGSDGTPASGNLMRPLNSEISRAVVLVPSPYALRRHSSNPKSSTLGVKNVRLDNDNGEESCTSRRYDSDSNVEQASTLQDKGSAKWSGFSSTNARAYGGRNRHDQLQASLFILLRSAPEYISQPSTYNVDQGQSHCRPSYDASSPELVYEADPPPPC
jgi:hypothetical protein